MESVRVCIPAFQGVWILWFGFRRKETIYGNKDRILVCCSNDEARKGFKCIACLEKAS